MALTIQQNGSQVGGQANRIQASWFNDYHDLLTGLMTDQDISPKTDLIIAPIAGAPATAPTAALAAGTSLGVGAYKYVVTFVKQGQSGESLPGPSVTVTTTTNNQVVSLSAIPLGPAGTTSRKLYRTTAGGANFLFLTTLSNNTATTYTDTTADGSLGAAAPTVSTFGGRLLVKDSAGTINASILSNGQATFTSVSTTTLTVGGQPGIVQGGGSYAGYHLFVGPNQPTGQVKGDVWIKTPF